MKEQAKNSFCNMADSQPSISEEEILKIFSTGEKVEKTPRGSLPPTNNINNNNNKPNKKKGKPKK
jgi:hypothetical protein